MPAELLAFDVNETLLDLSALDPLFVDVFGDASLRPVWFQTMLQLSFVGGLTQEYVDFTMAQHAALNMVAQRAGRALTSEQADSIVGGMRRLPPHPEAPAALRRLRDAGFRQVTLTNSTLEVAKAQLEFAGIAGLFEATISADEVRALKPAAAPYRYVAQRTSLPVDAVRLIAAHAWDVSGALAAGARAAFVARPGAVPSPLGRQPDIIGRDLEEIADQLLARA
ncbi:MAG TPA: haloacid dehalogenase type II [Dehalococcoidia bacterium]|nr:haloacid dehalogenase type II [Dehalococcoidia bacterium]